MESQGIPGKSITPSSAKPKKKPPVQKDEVVTVATLCSAFLAYVKSHPDEYLDQRNPPRRIEEILQGVREKGSCRDHSARDRRLPAAVQEDRELANAIINKLRSTFSMLYKHGKRKDLVNLNPAEDVPSRTPGTVSRGSCRWTRSGGLRAVLTRNIEACDPEKHPELRKQAIERMIEFDVSIRSRMRRSEHTTCAGRTWNSIVRP